MRPTFARVAFALALLTPGIARATAFGIFQHGGRAAAQAGALVARADDAAAVRYNPAGLATLDGWHGQAGLDFQAPDEEFSTGAQTDAPKHVIQFPPEIYLSWKPSASRLPLVFGLGVDSPFWTIEDWNTALFPGRFDVVRQELTLFEVRPTVAWAIGERWSVGGALRYVTGSDETTFETRESFLGSQTLVPWEITSHAKATVDGYGVDFGVRYAAPSWGLGATLSSGVALDGSGAIEHQPRDFFADAQAEADFNARFTGGPARLDFELPATLALGVWWAPRPELSIEVDAAWSGWSALDRTSIELEASPYSTPPPALDRRRDWKDTLSLRMGGEWRFTSGWTARGGLALEPSPVPDATAEPGFARGDATVIALGGGYDFEWIAFDLGYSRHLYADRDAALRGEALPIRGTFSGASHVFSISARWKR